MSSETLSDLRACSIQDLEARFASDAPVYVPEGRYRGIHLARLDNPGARVPWVRTAQYLGFEAVAFGVDFDDSAWFFVHPALLLGRFQARVGPSRWRPTDAVTLDYACSRLPRPVRDTLYDEVKPLGPSLCLGLGGLNAERDRGDHFFFALERIG